MDDRLSYLPRDIRDRILSFLPTKHAIQTTILSSKWRNVCSTLSNLVFNQYYFSLSKTKLTRVLSEKKFIEYVNQTVFHHDDTDIYKFILFLNVFDFKNFIGHLDQWIILASTHNARIMTISLSRFERPQRFPVYLFASNNSLTKLSLSGMTLILPTDAELEFRNLKSFYAEHVVFSAVSVTDQLLASSVLETLEMFCCSWESPFHILCLPSLKLKSLKLVGEYPFYEIRHSSPDLYALSYNGPPNLLVNPSSSLKDACFTLPHISNATDVWGSKVINGLCNVVDLRLDGLFLEFLVNEGQFLLAQLPTSCCSLKKLKLKLHPTKNQFLVMMFLLMRFPRLETLYLHIEGGGSVLDSLNTDKYWETKELNSDSFPETLKTVVIEHFWETEFQLDIIRHLLENSPALERMDIKLEWFYTDDTPIFIDFHEKINGYTRASDVTVSVMTQPDSVYLFEPSELKSLETAYERANTTNISFI